MTTSKNRNLVLLMKSIIQNKRNNNPEKSLYITVATDLLNNFIVPDIDDLKLQNFLILREVKVRVSVI